jgi:hypothetical protein
MISSVLVDSVVNRTNRNYEMSMNLAVKFGKYRFDLWQTPTYITYMCIGNKTTSKLNGARAKEALERYIIWAESTLNGVWDSEEELEFNRFAVAQHVAELRTEMTTAKSIMVFVI